MNPGVYTMTAGEYHADPCEQPSLTASIAKILCASSPLHAWTAHPRLNPDAVKVDAEKFDVGVAAHALLLEGVNAVAVIDAADWRTAAAKAARDEARANGQIPLLADKWAAVQEMADAVGRQLEAHAAQPPIFGEGRPEQTLIWQENGITCRARLDWLHDNHQAIDDLKTTSRTANPDAWTRSLFGMGYDVQAAFYLRGLEAVTGVRAEFRFVVVENYPPYALSVVGLGPDALELANVKVDHAIRLWRECLTTNHWPAYPTKVCWAELPGWEMTRWMSQYEGEEVAA